MPASPPTARNGKSDYHLRGRVARTRSGGGRRTRRAVKQASKSDEPPLLSRNVASRRSGQGRAARFPALPRSSVALATLDGRRTRGLCTLPEPTLILGEQRRMAAKLNVIT